MGFTETTKLDRKSGGSRGMTKGSSVTFYWESFDRDGQKETSGQIRLKLDDLAR
jgi:hypothetical protein